MQQHFIRNYSIIPVEGISRREIFDGIPVQKPSSEPVRAVPVHAVQKEILRRLNGRIPTFIDDSVQPGKYQVPNIFMPTSYDIPLPLGTVNAVVWVSDSLDQSIMDLCFRDEAVQNVARAYQGQSGVIIQAKYHWNGNEGKGLQLGRFADSWVEGLSANPYSNAFERFLNCLCLESPLTKEIVLEKALPYPLFYIDGALDISANIRDVSLPAMQAADKPVGEFMAWMQKNAVTISTAGELLRLMVHSDRVAKDYRMGRVAVTFPQMVESVADKYFELAQVEFAQLCPPKNNRMDYLVH